MKGAELRGHALASKIDTSPCGTEAVGSHTEGSFERSRLLPSNIQGECQNWLLQLRQTGYFCRIMKSEQLAIRVDLWTDLLISSSNCRDQSTS